MMHSHNPSTSSREDHKKRKKAEKAARKEKAAAKANTTVVTYDKNKAQEMMLHSFSQLDALQIVKLIRFSMSKNGIPRIALDIGGVIMNASNTSREDTDASSGVTDMCLNAVKKIVELFGSDNVFIISKARKKMADASLTMLYSRNFFEYTGLLEENVYFCKERIQKKPIAESLGITHFVDDRWSVLEHLDPDRTIRYLFPNPRDNSVPRGEVVCNVSGWSALLAELDIPIQTC